MDLRPLPILLFASLALNVFVGGAFVGAHLTEAKAPPSAPAQNARPRNPVAAAVRELSPDQQAAWRAQMPEFGVTFGAKGREARQLTRETLRGFGREPFDPAAALADLQRARGLEHEARQEMDRRLVAFAATLPAADRAKFGEALARPALGRRGAGEGDRRALPER